MAVLTSYTCEDVKEWGKFFENPVNRRVAEDEGGNIRVSTVFLAIDHGHGFTGQPVLFETMVFKNGEDIFCDRYATWDAAEKGHAKAVKEHMTKH